jgi:hypothetical protein
LKSYKVILATFMYIFLCKIYHHIFSKSCKVMHINLIYNILQNVTYQHNLFLEKTIPVFFLF